MKCVGCGAALDRANNLPVFWAREGFVVHCPICDARQGISLEKMIEESLHKDSSLRGILKRRI